MYGRARTRNPKRVSETTTLSAVASDALSGVVNGEYYIGADPGVGAAIPLTLTGNTLTATIPVLATGLHPIGVRARDAAGNWSTTTTDTLVIYDPTGGFVTAAGRITPGGSTSDAGDALPGLDHTSSANIHFQLRYEANGSAPTGTFAFSYRMGGINLDSTVLDWLVITSGTAVAQGTATIRGQTGTFPFRRTATPATEHVLLRVYPIGANPGSSAPLYQASGRITGRLLLHS